MESTSTPFQPAPFRPGPGGVDFSGGTGRARELVAELRSRAPAARLLAIQQERRFARRDLVELLIAESFQNRFDDVAEAVALARLAVAAAGRLTADRDASSQQVADLQAEAAATLGNALRVSGNPREAEGAFIAAERLLAGGSADPLFAARLADLKSSLYRDQLRFPEAHAEIESAIAVYRRAGLSDWVARALVKHGNIYVSEGRAEAALRVLREAVPLLRPEFDLQTFALCAHNVVDCLNRTGYSIAARSMVADLRRLHEKLCDATSLLRLAWLEARIDLELGADERAEKSYRAVRRGFIDRGMPYDAALASLDLAEIYARRQDPLPMQRLAEEMLPIFQSQHIHREAVAALIVFREAVAMRGANVSLIRDVARFLGEARRDRTLRFRPRG